MCRNQDRPSQVSEPDDQYPTSSPSGGHGVLSNRASWKTTASGTRAEKHILDEGRLAEVSTAENVVVNPCAGTSTTAKACLLLPEHCRFMGCGIDADCVARVEDGLFETYAQVLLISESDLTAPDNVMQAAQTFVLAMDAIHGKERLDMWSVPPRLLTVQTFPADTLYLILCLYGATDLHLQSKNIAFLQWT